MLEGFKITHIVNMASYFDNQFPSTITYYQIKEEDLEDTPRENILQNNVPWDISRDQFRWGAPEFVFTSEGIQKKKKRRIFGVPERTRRSVVQCSVPSMDF